MASNLTGQGIGMENFNVYDAGNPAYLLAKSRKKVPDGINSYAPGSPKPMRDQDQEHEWNSELSSRKVSPNSPIYLVGGETKNEQNGIVEANVDDQVKDAQIKLLTRNVTLLQAKLHQAEERLDITGKERDQAVDELRRMNEHFIRISQERDHVLGANKQLVEEMLQLRHIVKQNCDKLEPTAQNDKERDILCDEIQKLKFENTTLKKATENLASECSSLRESLSTVGISQSSSDISSMMSSQSCNKELESLHKVVDMLKSTVLKQRNFLLKFKGPLDPTSVAPESKKPKKTESNTVAVNYSRSSPRLRQGEESTGPLLNELIDESNSGRRVSPVVDESLGGACGKSQSYDQPSSANMVAGNLAVISKTVDIPQTCHQDLAHHNILDDPVNSLGPSPNTVYGNSYLENVDSGDKFNGSRHGAQNNDLIYMNTSELGLHNHANSPHLCHNGSNKNMSPKRDLPTFGQIPSVQISREHQPVRKISSEVIKRPSPNLSPKSKSDILAYNPNMKSQRQSDAISQWQQPPLAPSTISQTSWPQESSYKAPTNVKTLGQPSDSSQYYMQHAWHSRYHPIASGVGIDVTDGNILNTSPSHNVSDGMFVTNNTNQNDVSQLSSSPRQRHDSDRLCPVCSKDFGGVSIEQFQSHVLDCFDSENGPETIIADDSGPQRVCPMCNTSFEDKMPQNEFEKHVHSHFGEDPGENFEVLNP